MERPAGRSTGVEQAIAASLAEAPADADAEFEALYRSSRDDVYAYAAGLLRDRAAAEDVTALAFERAYRKRRRFNSKRGTRRAWLFGIARNAALDELRRRGRSAKLVGEPAVDDVAPEAKSLTTRKVASNAQLTLSTDPDKVRSVGDGVIQVTRRYHGLVINSQ